MSDHNYLLFFLAYMGMFVIGLGWVMYSVAASGAWSESVMPKREIKSLLSFAIGCTVVGVAMIIVAFVFKH